MVEVVVEAVAVVVAAAAVRVVLLVVNQYHNPKKIHSNKLVLHPIVAAVVAVSVELLIMLLPT